MIMKIVLLFKWSWHNSRCYFSISVNGGGKKMQPSKDYGARIAHRGKELSPVDKILQFFRRSLIIMLHYLSEKLL